MKPCQGPQLHKSQQCEGRGGWEEGRLWDTPGSPSAAGNKPRSLLSPPTSLRDDIYISHLSGRPMTPLGPTCQRVQET